MKKRLILALVLLLAGLQILNAIPAYPGKIVYTQPDGKRIVLQHHGDEFCHWTTNAAGKVVKMGTDGFYREVSEETVAQARRNAVARRSAAQQTRVARSAGAVRGQRHFLVVLVEFSDLPYTTCEDPHTSFDALLNEKGYSENGGTGSARDYFFDNSNGVFDPIFDVFGPVTLPEKKAYYGGNNFSGNDQNPGQALIDGCKLLDDEIDFSQYDSDGDGKVDMVLMYYAGYGEADSNDSDAIWPHEWSLGGQGKSLKLDGVKIDTYSCTNEKNGIGANRGKMCGIGTACHEFGHALGLPDMYDTDYNDNGYTGGLYSYSVMCSGSYNNEGRTPPYYCFEERKLLGWMTDSDCLRFDGTGTYSISPVNSNMVYRTDTDMDGEYFLYENRTKTGWDKYIPEEGLIVFHVDKSSRRIGWYTAASLWSDWESSNSINAYGSHPCCYIVPASDQSSLCHITYVGGSETEKPGIAFPYRSVNSYVPMSWNNVEGPVQFSQISFRNGKLTLRAYVPSGEVDYVSIADAGSYRAGDRFTFDLVCPEAVEAPKSVAWYYDDEPTGADSVTLTKGTHTVEAHLTNADGRRSVLTLEIVVK
jgi:M6 family metalloprotease-like protein